jgi:hypothetical protein
VVDADGLLVVDLVPEAVRLTLPPRGTGTFLLDVGQVVDGLQRAFYVETDQPVVVHQYNPICCDATASGDASLLLPEHLLGQEYSAFLFPSVALQSQGLVSLQRDWRIVSRALESFRSVVHVG